jgi:hypothetical protein
MKGRWGTKKQVVGLAGYASGRWNDSLQAIIHAACPEVNAKLYTAHCLRAGGPTAAVAAGVPLETVKQMLVHKCIDSTMVYTRPSEEQLRQAFASVAGPCVASQGPLVARHGAA